MKTFQRSLLIILDGWGHGPIPEVSAIAAAKTPFVDGLYDRYPNCELVTYGEEVGLPDGQMGNSEVGHLNIGAGRIVYQELARINKAIREKVLHENPLLIKHFAEAKVNNKAIHLIGLVSDGGVHSHINHLKALVEIAEEHGPENIFIHAFLDGRDTSPHGGKAYLSDLASFLEGKRTRIVSMIGRYYAMDRDKRWERVKKAYDLLLEGKGTLVDDLQIALEASYQEDITDEFVLPHALQENGQAVGSFKEGDTVLCYNFRTDRCREITHVLTQKDMPEHGMKTLPLDYITMTRYDNTFENIAVLFEKELLSNTMGQIISEAGLSQVRIAETEKYPHVTYFFNGGKEEPLALEKRILIPSPKVATYDLQPEMSAVEITDSIINEIKAEQPNFICLNYANTDMVGHTGVFEAAIMAAETVDQLLARLIPVAIENDYACIIIADHGNSDTMINPDGSTHTAHTKNPVPCFFIAKQTEGIQLKDGKLADIAPTILTLMGIDIPTEMDGEVLLQQAG